MSNLVIEVTSTSVSKKGTIWMQVKVVEGEVAKVRVGTKLDCQIKEEEK